MSRTRPNHPPRRPFVLVAAMLIGLSVMPWAGRALAATTVTFLPGADAYVQSGGPTSNYGKATVLRVRAPSPAYRSFLRFDVSGLGGPVTSARLRLYVTDATRDAGAVYAVSSAWTETAITWNNAPALPVAAIAPIGAAALGWVEVDVGSVVGANGTYAFAISSPSTDSLYTSSREGANPPQLVLSVDPTPAPTPT
ncbi:MAG: DNRLRE domain-containing protein, partial [Candidatus Limnocylindrales bacterium]